MAEDYENQLCKLADELINGPAGLESMKEHEIAVWNGPVELEAPFWILKCITNPKRSDLEFLMGIRAERQKRKS